MITRSPLLLATLVSCAYLGACANRLIPSKSDATLSEVDDSKTPFCFGGMNVTEYEAYVKPLFRANGIPVVEDTDHLGWINLVIVGIEDGKKADRLLKKDILLHKYHIHGFLRPAPPCECYLPGKP